MANSNKKFQIPIEATLIGIWNLKIRIYSQNLNLDTNASELAKQFKKNWNLK